MTRYRQGPPAGRGQVIEQGGADGGGRLRRRRATDQEQMAVGQRRGWMGSKPEARQL